jgi:hypothetical protein
MKNLLKMTAGIEVGTGLSLIAIPSILTTLLLGSSLNTSVGLTVARVEGYIPHGTCVIGYPAIRYLRIPVRKPVDVTWI